MFFWRTRSVSDGVEVHPVADAPGSPSPEFSAAAILSTPAASLGVVVDRDLEYNTRSPRTPAVALPMPPVPTAESGSYRPYTKTPGTEPLPGYTLLEPLGRGGFGEVWKCEAPGGLLKAVKFVGGAESGDGRAEQRF